MTVYYQLAGLYGPEAILSVLGVPVTSSPVTVYLTGTTTAASLYTDSNKVTPATNPVSTDGYGNLAFYAQPGLYDLAFSVGGVATTKTVSVTPFLGDAGVPSGVIMAYAAHTQPSGWFACDGTAVSRSTYSNLFAVIGTAWGVGNGTTTFNLPDCRGRSLFGSDGTASANAQPLLAFASTGGEWAHQLSVAELANHTHAAPTGTSFAVGLYNTAQNNSMGGPVGAGAGNGVTFTSGTDPGGTGSTNSHNNMHPYVVVTHIIKA